MSFLFSCSESGVPPIRVSEYFVPFVSFVSFVVSMDSL
jgi:hypothetical protein